MSNSQEEKRNEPFRIAIIGGGIGGLFCALAIHHHHHHHHHSTTATLSSQTDGEGSGSNSSNGGDEANKGKRDIQIDVYEQAPEYREIGAAVGVGINAARLLHRLGLGAGLIKVAGRRQGTWFTFRRFEDSGEVVSIPDADTEPGDVRQGGAAKLHTEKACAGVSVLDDGSEGKGKVEVRFRDGTSAIADLVVGCDGVHSVVRDRFVTDANNKSVESGMIAYRGIVPTSALEKDWPFEHWSNIWVAKHRHFLSYPIADNTQLNIVAFVTKRLGGGRVINDAENEQNKYKNIRESWSSLCDRAEVVADFDGFDEPVQRIIGLIDERPGRWKINDHEPLSRWHFAEGRVVLVGDAAHAMLPHMGAGAGQSIEDGWILGRALAEYLENNPPNSSSNRRKFESLESTMQFYQDVRLPRAQKVQAGSRVGGNLYELQTEEMSKLSYEDALPVMTESLRERMKFVWSEDVDDSYNRMRDEQAV
ncbi:hypothetical protein PG996_003449 [Apiospora saccharicola]|uniref:FAD-binding domain-containing protein n=1 Tax=Apiospora saccharicola TaxID=335842 RepID=A0ABR1W1B8_9PEZI